MDRIYPKFAIPFIKSPSVFYAVPLLGMFVKIVMLIPIFIELVFVGIATLIMTWINSFVVLFTGEYMKSTYDLTTGLLRLSTKTSAFFMGISDKYPGFSLEDPKDLDIQFEYPKNPSKMFAIPLFGGVVRVILLIPFGIFTGIVNYGVSFGIFVIGWIWVLFMRRYPESLYEMGVDNMRLSLASNLYMYGLKDNYPSFKISMNHKKIKIALLVIGALLFLGNTVNNSMPKQSTYPQQMMVNETPGAILP